MTTNEEHARKILSSKIELNIDIYTAKSLWILQDNKEPELTDSECHAIATNFPFAWQDIRQWFLPNYIDPEKEKAANKIIEADQFLSHTVDEANAVLANKVKPR